ncbi:MAG: hypothetical protein SGJ13_00825 [Actinomycetota bacterium]|nr:hypothetical protein [Actinomycetota bacterium]
MKRLYAELPGDAGAVARPVLDIVVEGMDEAPIRCLVDSGSVNTLLPAWVADLAGVALDHAEPRPLGVGGNVVHASFVDIQLTLGDHSWEAAVGFCENWPYGWGLLGQHAFFRYFVVTMRAADWELEVEPA